MALAWATVRATDSAAVKQTGSAKELDLVKETEQGLAKEVDWAKDSGKARDLAPDTRFDRQPWGRAKHSLRYCEPRLPHLDIAALRRRCCLPTRIHLLEV